MTQNYSQYSEGDYQCFITESGNEILTGQTLVRLINETKEAGQENNLVRTSRGSFKVVTLDSGFDVFIRRFMRGGWLRLINSDIFWSGGEVAQNSRPVIELVNAIKLYYAGVSVPLALAAALEPIWNGMAYRGFICYEAIPEATNLLASVGGIAHQELRRIAFDAGKEAGKMLNVGIMHLDLHIGNILLDKNQKVFLIDFDNSFTIRKDKKVYISRLVERWMRSVIKHKLPNEMIDQFKNGLSENI